MLFSLYMYTFKAFRGVFLSETLSFNKVTKMLRQIAEFRELIQNPHLKRS